MFICGLSLSVGWIVGLSIAAVALITFIVIMLVLVPFKLWFRAWVSSAHISMPKLIGMKLRKVDCQLITLNYITARKAGLKISVDELETHFMAGAGRGEDLCQGVSPRAGRGSGSRAAPSGRRRRRQEAPAPD